MKKVSKNIQETQKIAKEFLKKLKPNKKMATIIGLYGELGAGKTAFTQAFAKELEIKKKISSPTFVIMKKYMIPSKEHQKQTFFKYFFHIDAYRLKDEKELLYLNWEEIISNKEHLIFIEWPELIIKAIPKKHQQIHISHFPTQKDHKKEYRKFEIK